uniref:Somatostatin-1B-like n=1 Tax=Erpetoichthys calabaricus TaxID=27687 RepID=A0A8C4SFG4_ERPCA
MHFLSSLVPLLLILSSVTSAQVMPLEERLALRSGRVSSAFVYRKASLLRILSELSDFGPLVKDGSDVRQQSQLGERSVFSQSPPRERAPCKNFFWKTFSSC